MPRSNEPPNERLARASPLADTPGQAYVVRRGIPLAIANAASLSYDWTSNGKLHWLRVDVRVADGTP